MNIYFSKSKNGVFDDIVKVKNVLKQNNIVTEYIKGVYDPKIIEDCDIIVMLPPNPINDLKVNIGAGQYDEYIKNCYKKPILIIDNNLNIYYVEESDKIENDWQLNYATLYLNVNKNYKSIYEYLDWYNDSNNEYLDWCDDSNDNIFDDLLDANNCSEENNINKLINQITML